MDRKYPRAKFHDYNGGIYFITIVTMNRVHYFGNVDSGKMHLGILGKYLSKCIEGIPEHYSDADIHKFVIMPNHFHVIVQIVPQKNVNPVGSRHAAAYMDGQINLGCLCPPRHPEIWDDFNMRNHHNARLSVVVGGIKSSVKRYANRNGIEFGWQANFHDHIIRNQREYDLISDYIDTNPQRWGNDKFFNKTFGR